MGNGNNAVLPDVAGAWVRVVIEELCGGGRVSCHTVRRVGHTVAELACSSSATAWRRIVLPSVSDG
jgi:hypothetical protein